MLVTTQWPLKRAATSPHLSGFVFYGCLESLTGLSALWFGNILSFVVFSRPSLKHSATAFYFRILAIADTLALNFGLWPNWLRNCFGLHIYPITDTSCRIQTYLRYTLPDCAVWMLVIMTIERLIGVLWPHHVRTIFTHLRIRISVVIMVLIIGAVNVPSLWVAPTMMKTCLSTPAKQQTSSSPMKSGPGLTWPSTVSCPSWSWCPVRLSSSTPFIDDKRCCPDVAVSTATGAAKWKHWRPPYS